jgi:hypothetical protein
MPYKTYSTDIGAGQLKRGESMLIRNEDIARVITEVPVGHRHLRTTIFLADGSELVFQEAAIAGIVRAYVRVKTHPQDMRVELRGRRVPERKEGYAEWQLLEEE